MKAGGGVNAHVTREKRFLNHTAGSTSGVIASHSPQTHAQTQSNGCAGEGVVGAGRFEYLQSKITCLASRNAPGQPIKRLGHKSQ